MFQQHEMYVQQAGVRARHIPYKGVGPTLREQGLAVYEIRRRWRTSVLKWRSTRPSSKARGWN
jgi:hypothetical protein